MFQRPQHLLTRAARTRRVFYFEEVKLTEGEPHVEVTHVGDRLWVVAPCLPEGLDAETRHALIAGMISGVIEKERVNDYVAWYYTPYYLRHTRHLSPDVVVYDCMDELTLFRGANPALRELEQELIQRADVVFTGGRSLYEAKRDRHASVHLFPSSIDHEHFCEARQPLQEPADQAGLPHPRLGFYGVIDERLDLALLSGLATARPEWQIVLLGPMAKIDEGELPRHPNLHYLGRKTYTELPSYLAGWDVAIMPFAHNDATRFISPTKTPEYLAGGKPVVSTSIRDVVRPYGEAGLVRIADTVPAFVDAVEQALGQDPRSRHEWQRQVDALLKTNSWDLTWAQMDKLIEGCAQRVGRNGSAA